ncbi:MAG: nuclear transport factor 2 family protein [Gemmatimonadales bacterium]|nr:nuclear transport factor 2 family protein [Gemmatimonadales bacterium]MYG50374.1 nuclear transport factor 2 family protein [Gemmatimonadales bacterium]MYK02798.1 nuclear transport factor 2 family protein [Candidatus Palauibacter ramosifaciens]
MTNVTKFCLCLTAAAGLGCGAGAAPLTEVHAAAIRDSVSAAMQEFRDLGTAADWEAVGDFYSESPNFRFYENGTLQYRSAADVRAALGAFPPGTRIRTEYRDTDVVALAPGLAHVRARFESTFTSADGSAFGFGGAVTLIWTHEPGGWRILTGHSSAPVPRGG